MNLTDNSLLIVEEGVDESEVRYLPQLKRLLVELTLKKRGCAKRPFVKIQNNGCWGWVRTQSGHGYGWLSINKKDTYPHRFFYERLIKAIPKGLQIDHLCRNRLCCNPVHLEPVTGKENSRRASASKTHCVHGHEYTLENTVVYDGSRSCRICRKIKITAWNKKVKLKRAIKRHRTI